MSLNSGEVAGIAIGSIIGGFLLIALLLFLFRRWMQGPTFDKNREIRLDGKTVVITGANTGIGKICATEMSMRGAKVIMLCRSLERARPAAEEIEKLTGNQVIVHKMDLSSLASVREAADQLNNSEEKIDILLNNAGVMTTPEMRTSEGFELQIGTNHFGHFLLTNLLMPLIKKAAPGARIVTVSSLAHEQGQMFFDDINYKTRGYSAVEAYGQSKLANVLFTAELANQLAGSGVTAYSLHPGVIATELGRHIKDTYGSCGYCMLSMMKPFLKTPFKGAQTSLYCCLEPKIADENGKYYSDCREKRPAPQARKSEDARKLWEISEKLTGLKM